MISFGKSLCKLLIKSNAICTTNFSIFCHKLLCLFIMMPSGESTACVLCAPNSQEMVFCDTRSMTIEKSCYFVPKYSKKFLLHIIYSSKVLGLIVKRV
jgi:hypothetical protein